MDDGFALADEVKARELCRSRGLRALRLDRKVSGRRLAKVIGVNPSTLSRWERGVVLPSGGHAVALLRAAEALAATGSGR